MQTFTWKSELSAQIQKMLRLKGAYNETSYKIGILDLYFHSLKKILKILLHYLIPHPLNTPKWYYFQFVNLPKTYKNIKYLLGLSPQKNINKRMISWYACIWWGQQKQDAEGIQNMSGVYLIVPVFMKWKVRNFLRWGIHPPVPPRLGLRPRPCIPTMASVEMGRSIGIGKYRLKFLVLVSVEL